MAIDEEQVAYIEDQLSGVGEVTSKKMFGGVGFFKDEKMFGMLGGETFRLKVDESNKKDYEDRGMTPYSSDTKKKGMPYWEVPQDVLQSKATLKKWATKSINISQGK